MLTNTTKTISVYEALEMRKHLKEDYEAVIHSAGRMSGNPFTIVVNAKTGLPDGGQEAYDKHIKTIQSNIDNNLYIIDRYQELVAKLNESNAKTTIEVTGKTISVAEAIGIKATINGKINYYASILKNIENVEINNDRANKDKTTNSELNNYLATITPNIKNLTSEQLTNYTNQFNESRITKVVDPHGVYEMVKEKLASAIEFKDTIEFKLTEANVKAQITIMV